MKNQFIITRHDVAEKKLYAEYATIVQAIDELICETFGEPFQMYVDDDGGNLFFRLLYQDLLEQPSPVYRLANVFDLLETTCFERLDERYVIRPTILNGIFVYPQFSVVLVKTPIYQTHRETYQDFIFAPNDQLLQQFLNYTQMRFKNKARDTIERVVDTSDGSEFSEERMTRRIDREDVIMEDEIKQQIYRSIETFFAEDRSFFHKYEIPFKRGILLYGRPGNGKTTLVKSIASSVDAPVLYWQISEYTNSGSIGRVFEMAGNMAPMVLVIEDIDSLPESARSFFLNTLDGVTSKEGIFLIGTTNYPERIDPALMNRAGRFDRAYEMKLPSEALRATYLRKRGLVELVGEKKLLDVANKTKGFSFAQLNELFVSIALDFHMGLPIHVDQILKRYQGDLKQGNSNHWMVDSNATRVGFLVG